MGTRFRPLILWEAPGDDIMADFAKDEAGGKSPAKADKPTSPPAGGKDPAKADKPVAPAKTDDEPADSAPPPEDDPADTPPGDDAPPGDDPAGDDENDDLTADDGAAGPPADPVADRLRREQLLNEIESVRDQARSLERALAFLADRASEASARSMAAEARKIADEAARQCSVVLVNFSDLGHDRVLTVFRTVRERVSAVAEIVKHVIDGDDDFRDPRAGRPSGRA